MMMEMTDLGLGSIWVMNWDPAKMRKEFDLADHLEPRHFWLPVTGEKMLFPEEGIWYPKPGKKSSLQFNGKDPQ